MQYRENGQRQAEQNEARAVRIAMEELELTQEEKLFEAARDEAAELVYKHQNPGAAIVNPSAPYSYPGLARKKSTQRSRSVEGKDQDLQRANSKLRKRHSMSSAASGSRSSSLQSNGPGDTFDASMTVKTGPSVPSTKAETTVNGMNENSSALAKATSDLLDFKQRRRSSGSRRSVSGSLFRNPNDQIYEEPEEEAPVAPAPTPVAAEPPKPEKLPLGARRNPFMRFQSIKGNPMTRSNTDPLMTTKKFDRYEIQKNPPTQSRKAEYTSNLAVVKPIEDNTADAENKQEVKTKGGKEVRGEDIRAATGFRLRDRSPKLPTPTAVSDAPGRPIVSFKKDWNVVELKEDTYGQTNNPRASLDRKIGGPRPLTKSSTLPVVPTVNFPGEEPPKATGTSPSSAPTLIGTSPPTTSSHRSGNLSINIYDNTPIRSSSSASPANPINNTRHSVMPPVPMISVSEAPPVVRSRSTPGPVIPTISVSETPSISISAPSGRPTSMKTPTIGAMPPIPSISVSESPAPNRSHHAKTPSISVTPDIPMISVSDSSTPSQRPRMNAQSRSFAPPVPSISVNGPSGFGPAASTRPLPNPQHHISKSHSYNGSASPRTHWTPTTVRTGALCQQCALPIAGRIVSAGGSRFHPECFTCFQCGEHLECVAFYPEPSNKHAERVERIRARMSGQDITYLPTHPTPEDMARLEYEDGTDESSRFFCHLDFHELFSPRCKSCKTPIEGEVIVACGAEWHAGHFFCAQCGDPFNSSTPFVEKEGYAWCVNCHTNRFSTKCKGCRKPVTDTVVKALGAEWHANCFVCMVST